MLRRILVATTVLPHRDERMTQTERWVRSAIAERADADERQLLHRYVVWHYLRRLRARTAGTDTTHGQAEGVRARLRTATLVLDWLAKNELTLQTCQQADLDTWLAAESASSRLAIGGFVRWAKSHRLSTVEIPSFAWSGPTGTYDNERRWDQARRLLHDDTVAADDQLAGLLVLLYAQTAFAISRLSTEHLDIAEDRVHLRLGREPVVLPEPLGSIAARALASPRRERFVIGDRKTSPWLFPGGRAGQPVTAAHLGQRLRAIGVQPKPDRETALFVLAAELPPAVLSRLLGVHITVAATWQRAAAGSWTRYAAEVSRRPTGRHDEAAPGPS